MVFSSIPSHDSYLDPPNWPQQQQNQQVLANGTVFDGSQLLPPIDGSAMASARKPGLMVEGARLAKIPLPEAALKCPRCESTNTKFCYFNNYNLSQPRHFCKTCRRYWTRGGALRNVPVGGGCRRNKRSKPRNRSKSPVVSTSNNNPNQALCTTNILTSSGILGHVSPQIPLLPPLLGEFNSDDMGLNFRAVPATGGAGTSSSTENNNNHIVGQFRFHQFPFLTSLEAPPPAGSASVYSFGGEAIELLGAPVRSKAVDGTAEGVANMKMEVNLSRNNFLGIDHHHDQFWGGNIGNNNSNAWTTDHLSGFTSSSTNHNIDLL